MRVNSSNSHLIRRYRQCPSRRRVRVCRAHFTSGHKSERNEYNAFVSQTGEGPSDPGHGPLAGVTVAVKDTICTKDFKTTCSSSMLKDFRSPHDATVIRLLRAAGAVIAGKTNSDEFGMGSHNIHSVHGSVVNPFARTKLKSEEKRSAGGSSGGSAAAVLSGACSVALGTDTGGSTRLPAAYCGIAGLKPSYGLISRWGVVSYADSLDCVGILAREAKQIVPVFDALSRHDPKDPTSATEKFRLRAQEECDVTLSQGRDSALTIGIPQEYFPEELDDSVVKPLRALISRLEEVGVHVVPVSLPSTRYALSAYYVIASAEASSNLARYSGVHFGSRSAVPDGSEKAKVSDVYSHTRNSGFGNEVKKRILLGSYALSADAFDNYFLQAQRVRNMVKADFDHIFRSPNPLAHPSRTRAARHARRGTVDILLHPSAVGSAPLLSEANKPGSLDPYVQDVLTVPASLAGLPALSVPVGTTLDGWPLGVSIVGQWGHDRLVLRVGEALSEILRY